MFVVSTWPSPLGENGEGVAEVTTGVTLATVNVIGADPALQEVPAYAQRTAWSSCVPTLSALVSMVARYGGADTAATSIESTRKLILPPLLVAPATKLPPTVAPSAGCVRVTGPLSTVTLTLAPTAPQSVVVAQS